MKHAYLIMAHNEWDMLNKLIQALDYPNNDIYLHIDKKADLKKVNIYKTKYLDICSLCKYNWNTSIWIRIFKSYRCCNYTQCLFNFCSIKFF